MMITDVTDTIYNTVHYVLIYYLTYDLPCKVNYIYQQQINKL